MSAPVRIRVPHSSLSTRVRSGALISLLVCAVVSSAELAAQQHTETQRPPEEPTAFANLDALSWLVGSWGNENTLEHWTDGKGGLMLGVHRDLRDGRASFFEFLRIALTRDGGVVYLASPAGRNPPTVFPLSEISEDRVVFTNPEHDYPQRIDYSLEEGDLVVTISKADRSNQRTWRWQRLEADGLPHR